MDTLTLDRVSDYFTTESLGETQSLTPEGFLLCKSVPIARTGTQVYARGEIPVEPGADGLINITRDEEEVFHPDTIASFNGKPIVIQHPAEGKVTPDLWRAKSVGVVLNPRRGDGAMFDNAFMYADLLIQDQEAIDAVRDGLREVSAGYDAEYLQVAPGRGRQRNIVGNHVALVDKGRCGPRCAIGDEEAMANRIKMFRDRIRKAVRTNDEAGVLNAVAELSKDPDLMGEVISGDEDYGAPDDSAKHHVTINVHGGHGGGNGGDQGASVADPISAGPNSPGGGEEGAGGDLAAQVEALTARLDQVEQVLAMLADEGGGEEEGGGEDPAQQPAPAAEGGEEGSAASEEDPDKDKDKMNGDRATGDRRRTGDRRATVGDSSSLREGHQRMLSQAEILMPGIQLMTFDAAAPATTTFDAMCNFRRRTLEASKGTERGKQAISAVMDQLPKSFFDKSMTCDAIGVVFNGAASLIAQENSGRAHNPSFGNNGQRNGFSAKPPTPADLNAKYRDHYAKH